MQMASAHTERGEKMSDYIVRRRKNRADKVVGELVRCAECKYWYNNISLPTTEEDEICPLSTDADDFCSYGKVSEKPTGSERSSE